MKQAMITLLLTLFAATAFAEGDAPRPTFEEFDTNADGRISQSEAQADSQLARVFASADTNQDGYLSPSEFAAIG